jgi:hypothetical protein
MGKLDSENSIHKTDKSINMKSEQNTFLTSFRNMLESKNKNTSRLSSQDKINLTRSSQIYEIYAKTGNCLIYYALLNTT